MKKVFCVLFAIVAVLLAACVAAAPTASPAPTAGPLPTPGQNPGELWYAFIAPQDVPWIDVPSGEFTNAITLSNGEKIYQSLGVDSKPVFLQLPSLDKIGVDRPSDFAANKVRIGKAGNTSAYFDPIFSITLEADLRLAVTLCGWPHLYLFRPNGESWQVAVVDPMTSTCK